MSDSESSERAALRPVRPMNWWPSLLIVAAVATGYFWLQPVKHDVAVPKTFTATYTFDYVADVSDSGGVYSSGTLAFGDPVFLNVVDVVDVAVDFEMEGADATMTEGLLTTKVVVASDSGWSKLLYERADVAFAGNTTGTNVRVDFGSAGRAAKKTAASSGIEGRITVTVLATVEGSVTLPGRVEGGNQRASVTAASLVFDMNETSARVHGYRAPPAGSVLSETATGSAAATSVSADEPGTQAIADVANAVFTRPTTITVFKWDAAVDQLRRVGIVLTALFLLFTVYNLVLMRIAARRSEVDYLQLRHGTRIFPLLDTPAAIRAEAVWVGSFETLIAVAANAEVDILHRRGSMNDSYYVFDGPRVFGYAASLTRVRRPGKSAESAHRPEEGAGS